MKNRSWISPDWNSNNSKGIKDCENQKWNDQNNVLKNDNVQQHIFRMGEFLVRIFNSNLNIVIVLKKQKLNKKKKNKMFGQNLMGWRVRLFYL